jgi:dihydrofolate reductase
MTITIIVAADEGNVIGGHNQLLWKLPADFRRMKALTMGHPLIMGRKTHESIGRALPGRRNIVVTHKKDATYPGCEVAGSMEEAFRMVKDDPSGEAFIFGGGEIYRLGMARADKIEMTRVHARYEGDATFPEIDPKHWEEVAREDHEADEENPVPFSFITYRRRS